MSIESRIRLALAPFEYKVYPDTYNGKDEAYFVFNYNTIPDDFGNNQPNHERALIQLHLFCSHEFDTVLLRKNIKMALLNAGFTYPFMTDAGDEDGQHWVFEFEAVDDGED